MNDTEEETKMTREELLYLLGKWLGYWAGHYDGWLAASDWTRRYFHAADNFIEATQTGILIALERKHVPFSELGNLPYDPERARELADWFGREAARC